MSAKLAAQNLATAHRAGVTLVTGTDSGNPLLVHGPAIHRELQLWVQAGVPPSIALQAATRQLVSLYPELRLMCISVIKAAPPGEGPDELDTTTGRHLEHKMRLRRWVEPIRFPLSRASLHVIEGANAAGTLLDLARVNHVDLIVLGAPGTSQRALAWWRSVASQVTANAPCSVHVVRVPEHQSETEPGRI
jgi:nucleotide-binding universal stress UspA family protein